MLSTIADCFRVPDLRRRLITICLLALCRLGVYIVVPGVDPELVRAQMGKAGESGSILGFMNIFSGGALDHMAIFGLNVMPYISASIIFQLLVQVIPSLKKVAEEGESGRQKINQWTRYATVFLCFFQAYVMISAARSSTGMNVFRPDFTLRLQLLAALLMTAGSLLLMWIGEQIDEFGIGNGISLLIMSNIVARLPLAIGLLYGGIRTKLDQPGGALVWELGKVGFLIAAFVFVVFAITYITQGQRRIPFQQAKQMRGTRMYGGMKHYLPLQVNAANVIPIIFASSLLMFPGAGLRALADRVSGETAGGAFVRMLAVGMTPGSFIYTLLYVGLIFFFCYFWTAITFNPTDMAKHLQEHGSFIPGIRPGRRTSEYLERVMSRITLPGAASLALIAIIPTLLGRALDISWYVTEFFGGTTILIAVGVGLDLIRKVEAQLLIRHYEGFTRGSRRRF